MIRFIDHEPRRLWVADITYVRTWQGFAYVAFVTMPTRGGSLAEYPQLTAADVQACLGYAARAVDERELPVRLTA